MNNQRSRLEQLMISMALAFAAVWVMNNYFGSNNKPQVKDREIPKNAIVQAFKGIDPAEGPALTEDQARLEVKKIKDDIEKNSGDDYSRYLNLRLGLIEQYILKDLETGERKSGFLGFGPKVKYFVPYDNITHHAKADDIEAQALYQSGDLFWRQGIQKKDEQAKADAVTAFEALITHQRNTKEFGATKIFVPAETDPALVPLDALPPGGFKQVAVEDLRGSLAQVNQQGLLDRVNEFYAPNWLYKLFDSVVQALGHKPEYSYGLAILIFAFCTRILMQPLSKKQYESMKGMQLIAPEMKKIQDKYKGKTESDAQMQMVKEIQALQRRHGVNPYMGCALGMLQMPIFFLFVYPMIKHYEPKMDLAHASFLWVHSLAQPDYVLLVLYAISMFVSFRLSSTPPTDDQQRQMQIMMGFMMPFMMPLFLLHYPSAFVMYWMTFNATATVLQWRMMKAADPNKNVIKTLMGADLTTPAAPAATDSVPARPKSGKGETAVEKAAKAEDGGAKSNGKAADGALNGHLNGKAANNGGPVTSGSSKKKKR